ncbi:MAG: PLP-dependent aminotransferase family protein [Oscillospiraceae bacterium]|jgi:2-aminoadipate transaminase|nr:PLP-dependent aminotransferase family protein [Oscillospiraceae bacterium]
MNYNFSKKVSELKPSVIREILKFTGMPGIIPFAAGNPAAEAFPTAAVEEISAKILRERPIDALQYSITEGYPKLRETVRNLMKKQDSVKDFDDVIITSGAQQVMNLSTQALCNEGDTIICESPSFIGSLNAFRSFNVKLRGVPLESDGMNLEELERALKEEPKARFIYVIANFQNPSGVTTSLEKRKAIYELAKRYKVLIVEDNPYGETRFEGEALPNIKSMDTDGIVIYAGSFSKVISPGLRVGYAIAPKEVIAKLTVCKQVSDVHTGIFGQLIVDSFVNDYDFDAHIAKIKEIYGRKSRLMMQALDTKCPALRYNKIQGGLFIWCDLPSGINMLDFAKEAVEKSVAVVPGNAFLMSENEPCNSIRLNFSTPSDEQIVSGVDILSGLLS